MALSEEAAQGKRGADLLRTAGPPVLVFLLVAGLWQFGVFHMLLNIKEFQLPLPSKIIESFGARGEDLWVGTVYTTTEAVLGLLLGAALAFVAAALFVQSDVLRQALMPLSAAANAIPIVAFAPIVSRWLGFDQPTRIAVVTVMVFAPVAISGFKGLTSIDNNSLDLMSSYAATPFEVFRKLRLPASLPYVFSSLKVGATAAMIGSVVAEFFNSAGGIGKLIANNIQSGDFALAWCGVLIVTLVGLFLYLAISLIERLVIPWEVGIRGN